MRIVKLLLDGKDEGKDADINQLTGAVSSASYTPLIFATINTHEAAVHLLLERGADVAPRTMGGLTALSFATDKPAIRALLEAHGARE